MFIIHKFEIQVNSFGTCSFLGNGREGNASKKFSRCHPGGPRLNLGGVWGICLCRRGLEHRL